MRLCVSTYKEHMSDKPKPQAGSPQVPSDMRAFNEKLIAEFRANDGKLGGQLAGSRLLLITTTGARSGKPRTAVIGYRPHGDDLVAIASANGAPSHPAWYLNLLSNPTATVEVGAEKFNVRARTANTAERAERARLIDYLDRQQAKPE